MIFKRKKQFKLHTKRFYLRWACVGIGVLLLFCFLCATAFRGDDSLIDYIENYQMQEITPDQNIKITFNQAENCYEIDNTADRELKILQVSDTHLGCGFMTIVEDKMVVDSFITAVEKNKPDLIVVTGDLMSANYILSGTADGYTQIKVFISLMEKVNLPWTVVFGNHDSEGLASREYISEQLEKAENCLFRKGDTNISGSGNHHIKVYNDGKLDTLLFLMDTNSGSFISGYGGIEPSQIEWYETTLKSYQAVKPDIKSLLFVHIPLPEYKTYWAEYENGNPDYKLIYGERTESISAGEQFGFYDKVVQLNSTKWIFCGHDHVNNFSLLDVKNGIYLTFGLSMDYSAYIGAMGNGAFRGVTVIEVGENSTVTYRQAFESNGFISK